MNETSAVHFTTRMIIIKNSTHDFQIHISQTALDSLNLIISSVLFV